MKFLYHSVCLELLIENMVVQRTALMTGSFQTILWAILQSRVLNVTCKNSQNPVKTTVYSIVDHFRPFSKTHDETVFRSPFIKVLTPK